jgi:transposase-like protein
MTQHKARKINTEELVKIIQQTDNNKLLELLLHGINRFMDAEVSHILKAMPYERTGERNNYRNGYRKRKEPLKTSLGDIDISVPKLRQGSYYPSILEHYQRIDRALVSIISEAYFNGVSTRKMNNLFDEIGLSHIDRNTVSRCAAQIDEEVAAWRSRSLDQQYAYIWVDAIYTKIRIDNRVRSVAVLVAIGVKTDGYRDVLGFELGDKESSYNWKDFFQGLKERGLERAELWISDEHDGIIKAIEECFPGQLRQRCIVHWMRNALSKVPKSDLFWLTPALKDLVGSRTKDSFNLAWHSLLRVVESQGKNKLLDWLDDTYQEISVYLDFPSIHWGKIKSTNPLERLNGELRRRERSIRIFPDEKSCIRLFGAVLQEYSESWTSNKIYLLEPMARIQENNKRQAILDGLSGGLKLCSGGYATSTELQPSSIRNVSKESS